MIIYDVLSYLKADATLDSLLEVSSGRSKIYPSIKPQGVVVPVLLYDQSVGVLDENLDEVVLTLRAVTKNKKDSTDIKDQLKELLDLQDEIQGEISSTDYYIYWSKMTAGQSLIDTTDVDETLYVEVSIFSIKYKKKC